MVLQLHEWSSSVENLKVKVNSEAESKEVQDFLKLNGYTRPYNNFNLHNGFVCINGDKEILCVCLSQAGAELNDYKEITIPQLKDLVILKRNDVNDATHTDQDGWKWYIGADSYVWQAGNSQQLKQWDQSSLDMVDLEPINKEISETEYLMQGKNAERLMESVGQLKGSQWDIQVGGDHYKSMKIQPAKFALENRLDYCQANAIKYICRHESKNGKQDLEKAKHYIDLLIEHYYG